MFEERLKDIQADELIVFPDGSVQVNGWDLDGRHVWILLTIKKDCKLRFHDEPLHKGPA